MSDAPSELPPLNVQKQPKVREWFSRNGQGFILGIIGSLVAGGIFYALVESRSRDLSIYVNPAKTTIVKSGQSSDLHVLYKGQNVSTDVTALQVAIWNAGKESIRSEHVLSPIALATSPKTPILEARIRQTSRPVAGIGLDTTRLADGIVGVSWKILEHNDGAVIQIIFAGPVRVSIGPTGVIEGQRVIDLVDNGGHIWVWVLLNLIAGMLFSVSVDRLTERVRKHFGRRLLALLLFVVVLMLSYVGFVFGTYWLIAGNGVPFRFD